MASVGLLYFPSQEAIVTYLQKHPLTSDPYLTEDRIIQRVAPFFADKEKYPEGVNLKVAVTLFELNKELKFPADDMIAIQARLVAALTDCAKGRLIGD